MRTAFKCRTAPHKNSAVRRLRRHNPRVRGRRPPAPAACPGRLRQRRPLNIVFYPPCALPPHHQIRPHIFEMCRASLVRMAEEEEQLDADDEVEEEDAGDAPQNKLYRRKVNIEFMETLLCASMMEVVMFGKTDMDNVHLRLVFAYNLKLRDQRNHPRPPLWPANECTPSPPPTLPHCFC